MTKKRIKGADHLGNILQEAYGRNHTGEHFGPGGVRMIDWLKFIKFEPSP